MRANEMTADRAGRTRGGGGHPSPDGAAAAIPAARATSAGRRRSTGIDTVDAALPRPSQRRRHRSPDDARQALMQEYEEQHEEWPELPQEPQHGSSGGGGGPVVPDPLGTPQAIANDAAPAGGAAHRRWTPPSGQRPVAAARARVRDSLESASADVAGFVRSDNAGSALDPENDEDDDDGHYSTDYYSSTDESSYGRSQTPNFLKLPDVELFAASLAAPTVSPYSLNPKQLSGGRRSRSPRGTHVRKMGSPSPTLYSFGNSMNHTASELSVWTGAQLVRGGSGDAMGSPGSPGELSPRMLSPGGAGRHDGLVTFNRRRGRTGSSSIPLMHNATGAAGGAAGGAGGALGRTRSGEYVSPAAAVIPAAPANAAAAARHMALFPPEAGRRTTPPSHATGPSGTGPLPKTPPKWTVTDTTAPIEPRTGVPPSKPAPSSPSPQAQAQAARASEHIGDEDAATGKRKKQSDEAAATPSAAVAAIGTSAEDEPSHGAVIDYSGWTAENIDRLRNLSAKKNPTTAPGTGDRVAATAALDNPKHKTAAAAPHAATVKQRERGERATPGVDETKETAAAPSAEPPSAGKEKEASEPTSGAAARAKPSSSRQPSTKPSTTNKRVGDPHPPAAPSSAGGAAASTAPAHQPVRKAAPAFAAPQKRVAPPPPPPATTKTEKPKSAPQPAPKPTPNVIPSTRKSAAQAAPRPLPTNRFLQGAERKPLCPPSGAGSHPHSENDEAAEGTSVPATPVPVATLLETKVPKASRESRTPKPSRRSGSGTASATHASPGVESSSNHSSARGGGNTATTPLSSCLDEVTGATTTTTTNPSSPSDGALNSMSTNTLPPSGANTRRAATGVRGPVRGPRSLERDNSAFAMSATGTTTHTLPDSGYASSDTSPPPPRRRAAEEANAVPLTTSAVSTLGAIPRPSMGHDDRTERASTTTSTSTATPGAAARRRLLTGATPGVTGDDDTNENSGRRTSSSGGSHVEEVLAPDSGAGPRRHSTRNLTAARNRPGQQVSTVEVPNENSPRRSGLRTAVGILGEASDAAAPPAAAAEDGSDASAARNGPHLRTAAQPTSTPSGTTGVRRWSAQPQQLPVPAPPPRVQRDAVSAGATRSGGKTSPKQRTTTTLAPGATAATGAGDDISASRGPRRRSSPARLAAQLRKEEIASLLSSQVLFPEPGEDEAHHRRRLRRQKPNARRHAPENLHREELDAFNRLYLAQGELHTAGTPLSRQRRRESEARKAAAATPEEPPSSSTAATASPAVATTETTEAPPAKACRAARLPSGYGGDFTSPPAPPLSEKAEAAPVGFEMLDVDFVAAKPPSALRSSGRGTTATTTAAAPSRPNSAVLTSPIPPSPPLPPVSKATRLTSPNRRDSATSTPFTERPLRDARSPTKSKRSSVTTTAAASHNGRSAPPTTTATQPSALQEKISYFEGAASSRTPIHTTLDTARNSSSSGSPVERRQSQLSHATPGSNNGFLRAVTSRASTPFQANRASLPEKPVVTLTEEPHATARRSSGPFQGSTAQMRRYLRAISDDDDASEEGSHDDTTTTTTTAAAAAATHGSPTDENHSRVERNEPVVGGSRHRTSTAARYDGTPAVVDKTSARTNPIRTSATALAAGRSAAVAPSPGTAGAVETLDAYRGGRNRRASVPATFARVGSALDGYDINPGGLDAPGEEAEVNCNTSPRTVTSQWSSPRAGKALSAFTSATENSPVPLSNLRYRHHDRKESATGRRTTSEPPSRIAAHNKHFRSSTETEEAGQGDGGVAGVPRLERRRTSNSFSGGDGLPSPLSPGGEGRTSSPRSSPSATARHRNRQRGGEEAAPPSPPHSTSRHLRSARDALLKQRSNGGPDSEAENGYRRTSTLPPLPSTDHRK